MRTLELGGRRIRGVVRAKGTQIGLGPWGMLQTVALVLLVELLVDRHHLGVGARLDVVPRRRVVLAVPDDVRSTCQSAQVPCNAPKPENKKSVSMSLSTLRLGLGTYQVAPPAARPVIT